MSKISKRRQEADAAFSKVQKTGWRSDKSDALQAYEAGADAVRARSERLKAQRLTDEAAGGDAKPARRRPSGPSGD